MRRAAPNPRLQRTPSAAPPWPLSSQPLGAKPAQGRGFTACVLLLLLSVATVSGCTTVKVTYVDPSPRAETQPSAVQVLWEEPGRAYRVVARFRFEDKGWRLTKDELDRRVRQEAARLGGEAVVLDLSVQNEVVPEGLLVGHTAEVSQQILFARVIVFTDPGIR